MSGASSRDRNVWWHDDQLRWLTTSVTDWGWRNRLRCCWHQAILVHRLRLSTCPWNGDVRSWRNCQLSSVQVPTAWLSSLAFLWMVVSFPVTKRCNLLTWFRRLTTAFCFFSLRNTQILELQVRTLKMACSVRLCRSVKTKRGFLGAGGCSTGGGSSLRLHGAKNRSKLKLTSITLHKVIRTGAQCRRGRIDLIKGQYQQKAFGLFVKNVTKRPDIFIRST